MHKNGRYSRKYPELRYKKRFIISTEGRETEPVYFAMLQKEYQSIILKILRGKKGESEPVKILKKAQRFAGKNYLTESDEVWLVIDRNTWKKEQLDETFRGCESNKFSLAVSNPCFEYWLLLHFETPPSCDVDSADKCRQRLRRHLPEFEKSKLPADILILNITEAIKRAEKQSSNVDQ
jgi:hypothetical protein